MADAEKYLHVRMPIRVKTYDIDFVGHVNNIVYVRWLEDLRLELLDRHYPLEPMRARNIAPIIVTTSIHYRQGIDLSDEVVDASMWISSFERATFHLTAEFRVGEALRATATQRGTFVDTVKMRPIRIPQDLREKAGLNEG